MIKKLYSRPLTGATPLCTAGILCAGSDTSAVPPVISIGGSANPSHGR